MTEIAWITADIQRKLRSGSATKKYPSQVIIHVRVDQQYKGKTTAEICKFRRDVLGPLQKSNEKEENVMAQVSPDCPCPMLMRILLAGQVKRSTTFLVFCCELKVRRLSSSRMYLSPFDRGSPCLSGTFITPSSRCDYAIIGGGLTISVVFLLEVVSFLPPPRGVQRRDNYNV